MANLCWPAVLASLVVALLSNAPLAAGHDMSAPRATDPHYYEGFANPIRMHAPDPSILYADGVYAMVYTSDRNISMTRASTLAGLEAGETRLIWDDDTEERAAHMWAPEIHLIDETWYLFYSACNSSVPCCETCKTRVLRGCDGPQPYECTYEYLATLVPEPGLQGGLHKNESFSIDGTYMEIPGWGRYHVVSARGHGGMQSIQITELDTDSWTVKEWHIISAPDQTVCFLLFYCCCCCCCRCCSQWPHACATLVAGDDIPTDQKPKKQWEANATNTVPSPGIAALEEAPNVSRRFPIPRAWY